MDVRKSKYNPPVVSDAMAIRSQIADFKIIVSTDGLALAGRPSTTGQLACFAESGADCYTTGTQFVVVHELSCSPSGNWALQEYTGGTDIFVDFRINTSRYFQGDGVRGMASPYPKSSFCQGNLDLDSGIYVPPGQGYELLFFAQNVKFRDDNPENYLMACVRWTLYDGVDAVIANKLLEMGISISSENIDWYKKTMIGTERASR